MDQRLRDEIHKAMVDETPRYLRAKRFADQVAHLVQNFTPQDRECVSRLLDHLMEAGFRDNIEIISVPPEFDELDKLQIERRMLETHPAFVKTLG